MVTRKVIDRFEDKIDGILHAFVQRVILRIEYSGRIREGGREAVERWSLYKLKEIGASSVLALQNTLQCAQQPGFEATAPRGSTMSNRRLPSGGAVHAVSPTSLSLTSPCTSCLLEEKKIKRKPAGAVESCMLEA